MMDQMTPEQFIRWRAFSLIEPFAIERADYNAALIAKTLWDINRDQKRHPRPFPLNDFVLKWDSPKKQKALASKAVTDTQTPTDRAHALRMWAMAFAAPAKDVA